MPCLKKSKKILEQLNKINSIVDIEKGEVIRLIQSEEGIRIIIDEKNLDKFFNYFSKNDCISIEKNLTEINLHFSPEASKTKGNVAYHLTQLLGQYYDELKSYYVTIRDSEKLKLLTNFQSFITNHTGLEAKVNDSVEKES